MSEPERRWAVVRPFPIRDFTSAPAQDRDQSRVGARIRHRVCGTHPRQDFCCMLRHVERSLSFNRACTVLMRLLFVIGNLGDYHVPRYEALAKLADARGDKVCLVEVFGRSGAYGFPQEGRIAFFQGFPRDAVTLVEDAGEADRHWWRVGIGLLAALRRCRPDVVVTLGYSTYYSLFLRLLKALGRRFTLIYMSDSKADDGRRYALKERLKKVLVSGFDGALVAGEKHRAYAQSLGVPMSRSRIGFDVIDVEYFSAASRAALENASTIRCYFGLPARYVICVSRFIRRKNVELLIEAFCQSQLHAAGLSLLLVGQGPCGPEIRNAIDRLGMSRYIQILGCVPCREMPALYSLAEFAVLPSAYDQWGLCISEAFAAAKPAIVTSTCGVANELVLDGINGFIVRPGDAEALADRLVRLATDDALRERFSQNAVSTVRGWTPTLFATNVIELTDSLTGAATSLVRSRGAAA
ncbi:glycosyltransferase family 4 protein [Paraburkholderia phymatum]|uniref:glycosyltransferase family 4 protein n=1 Tax=Paraburkholderia phymatum TaxID=148447 RepID=UPI00317C9D99